MNYNNVIDLSNSTKIRSKDTHIWYLLGWLYLLSPLFLFFATWLRVPYSLIVLLMLILSILFLGMESVNVNKFSLSEMAWKSIMLPMATCLILAFFSGAGGFVTQKGDWTKHNVILNDLMKYDWPVYYGRGQLVEHTSLVYYVAYYLHGALLGKIFGWNGAQLGLFIQNLLGLAVFGGLIKKMFGIGDKLFLLFFFLSGLDIVGMFVFGNWPKGEITHIEYPVSGIQYSSMMTLLMWVPQHALPGWLAGSLAYYDYLRGRISSRLFLYAGITFLWSPFVTLGLLLTFGLFSLSKKLVSFYNVVGAVLLLIIALYYRSGLNLLKDQAWLYIFSKTSTLEQIMKMIVFLSIELFVFAPFILLAQSNMSKKEKIFVVWLFISLMLIPQITYGTANDFPMRVSIPGITLLYLIILSNIDSVFSKHKIISIFLAITIALGTITPFVELIRTSFPASSRTNEQPNVNMLYAHKEYEVLHQQYMGLATKMFGKLIGNYATSNK